MSGQLGGEFGATTGRPAAVRLVRLGAVPLRRAGERAHGSGGDQARRPGHAAGAEDRVGVPHARRQRGRDFPADTGSLGKVEPVYETMAGWQASTRWIRALGGPAAQRAPLPRSARGAHRGAGAVGERGHRPDADHSGGRIDGRHEWFWPSWPPLACTVGPPPATADSLDAIKHVAVPAEPVLSRDHWVGRARRTAGAEVRRQGLSATRSAATATAATSASPTTPTPAAARTSSSATATRSHDRGDGPRPPATTQHRATSGARPCTPSPSRTGCRRPRASWSAARGRMVVRCAPGLRPPRAGPGHRKRTRPSAGRWAPLRTRWPATGPTPPGSWADRPAGLRPLHRRRAERGPRLGAAPAAWPCPTPSGGSRIRCTACPATTVGWSTWPGAMSGRFYDEIRQDPRRVPWDRQEPGGLVGEPGPPGPGGLLRLQGGWTWTSREAARYHFVPDVAPSTTSLTPTWRLEGHLDDEGYTPGVRALRGRFPSRRPASGTATRLRWRWRHA